MDGPWYHKKNAIKNSILEQPEKGKGSQKWRILNKAKEKRRTFTCLLAHSACIGEQEKQAILQDQSEKVLQLWRYGAGSCGQPGQGHQGRKKGEWRSAWLEALLASAAAGSLAEIEERAACSVECSSRCAVEEDEESWGQGQCSGSLQSSDPFLFSPQLSPWRAATPWARTLNGLMQWMNDLCFLLISFQMDRW